MLTVVYLGMYTVVNLGIYTVVNPGLVLFPVVIPRVLYSRSDVTQRCTYCSAPFILPVPGRLFLIMLHFSDSRHLRMSED